METDPIYMLQAINMYFILVFTATAVIKLFCERRLLTKVQNNFINRKRNETE